MSKLDKLASLVPLHLMELEAQQQIYNALDNDFLIKLAIMPDCHPGYALPIGGVALLDNVISPSYVGYDIGCGMCTVITDELFNTVIKDKQKVYDEINRVVPNGLNGMRLSAKKYIDFKSASSDKNLDAKVNAKIGKQAGTLGSGNHFIELGQNGFNNLCITIHSGSRNPGHTVCSYYMKIAKDNDTDLTKDFLHLDSEFGQMYLQDMDFMLKYALDNRKIMMSAILDILDLPLTLLNSMINENHNHAEVNIDKTVLHRKGATPAKVGQLGIIPGNMRDGVYITRGMGNLDYLESSSHGAGRKGSRTWAKESITLDKFEQSMKGIIANVSKHTLDESPFAYKDLSEVIKAQEGICIKVVDHINSLINIKGL